MLYEITYKNGKGNLQIDLSMLLPCTGQDFRRLLSVVDLSEDPGKHAKVIYDHIAEKVAALKAERETFDENSIPGKKRIAKIDAEIKRYLANAAALVKGYGLPEMEESAAQVVMHAATVYGIVGNPWDGTRSIEQYDGWTFEKCGYAFDVRREKVGRKTEYVIMLHGTGCRLATSPKKCDAPAEVTPRIIEAINAAPDKIEEAKRFFVELMIAAGYMDEEPEKEADRDEDQTKSTDGERSEIISESFAGVAGPDENTIEKLPAPMAGHDAPETLEKQIVNAFKDIPVIDAKTGETVSENAAEMIEQAAAEAGPNENQTTPARDPKQARGPVPEKTFIGETITGNGWRIYFDGATNRTRIIFDSAPNAAAKKALDDAGFYYSSNMDSWNKKLTFKAYRAAKAMSETLSKLYAA